MIFTGAIRVKAEVELVFPAELETRFGHGIVTDLRTRPAFGEVSGVSGNAPSDLEVAVNIVHTYIGDLQVYLIAPDGSIRARYDKMHMFDVTVSDSESYRESAAYRPGDRAVLAQGPWAVGMTVCYDIRFAQLYRALAQAGAQVLTVPAAFSPVTGAAHWETLLRARAIETGCYVLAPAQTGTHPQTTGRVRATHGHSLAVAPWGEVLADAGTQPGVVYADLDLEAVRSARARVPSLTHDRPHAPPEPAA